MAVTLLISAGCASGPPGPAALDPRNDTCAHCRMPASDIHFAAQLVAPHEEPTFFDDVGCLRDYLAAHADLPDGSRAFVADHRTGEWVAAADAVYVRNERVDTPMNSHLLAHADAASREADPAAAGGAPLEAAAVFGPGGPPGGQP